MQLFSTKYPNNTRTISGLINEVYRDDVILLCDTTAGPVQINLLGIPADYWSTQYKIYIFDKSNNAGTNNITIVAPEGFKVNNAQTLVVSVSGGGALVRIGNNTNYIGDLNYCCGGSGTGLIVLLNAALLALISAGQIIPGAFYLVTDAGITDSGCIVQGTTTISVSTEGTGIFFNPRYVVSAPYVGVWKSSLVGLVANVSIATYNGLMYKNLTGAAGTAPNIDTTNWAVLAKSTANGYVQESDFVKYDPVTNLIRYRADKRLNEIEHKVETQFRNSTNAISDFQWGNDLCVRNKAVAGGYILNINQTGTFKENVFSSEGAIDATDNSGTIYKNNVTNGSVIVATNNTGYITANVVQNFSIISATNNAGFIGFDTGDVTNSNVVSNSSRILAANQAANGYIYGNIVQAESILSFITNAGVVADNVISNGILSATTNTFGVTECEVGGGNTVDLDVTTADVTLKRCVSGFSNFEMSLNLDDPTLFNTGTNTLTIPVLFKYVGVFNLYSAAMKSIIKIVNLPTNHTSTFMCLPTFTETFQNTALPASANCLVCDAGSSANILVGRTNGSDFIKYKPSGNLNVRENVTILS